MGGDALVAGVAATADMVVAVDPRQPRHPEVGDLVPEADGVDAGTAVGGR
jgi:hypothetical protein